MKNCAGSIVYAISLLLTLILVLDAFADDEHYKKKDTAIEGDLKKLIMIMTIMIVTTI